VEQRKTSSLNCFVRVLFVAVQRMFLPHSRMKKRKLLKIRLKRNANAQLQAMYGIKHFPILRVGFKCWVDVIAGK
jgi:hypothetical protein